jgi:hypothetical protein
VDLYPKVTFNTINMYNLTIKYKVKEHRREKLCTIAVLVAKEKTVFFLRGTRKPCIAK